MGHSQQTRSRVVCTALSSIAVTGTSAQSAWVPLGEPGCGGQPTSIAVSPHDPRRVLVGGDMLGVGLSIDGGDNWLPTFGFRNWQIGEITWHPSEPDTVWVGTMSGPYRSTDGGVTWVEQRIGMGPINLFAYSTPIEKVLFDPNDENRLLAFTGSSRRWGESQTAPQWGAVWEWDAVTENWTKLTTITPTGSSTAPDAVGRLIVDAEFGGGSSTRLYATLDDVGVFRSDDGGTTWTIASAGLPSAKVERLAAHPTDPDTVYVALANDGLIPGSVYVTTDGGQQWSPSDAGLSQNVGTANSAGVSNNTSRFRAIEIAETDPTVLYTSDFRFGSTQGMARTDDAGATWQTQVVTGDVTTFATAGIEMRVIEIDPNNPERAFAAGTSYVMRTKDGGTTWEDVTQQQMPTGFVGTGYTGWVATGIAFNPWDPDHAIVQGFDSARVIQTLDGGPGWTREGTSPTPFGGGRDAHFASPSVIYTTYGQPTNGFEGVGRSLDGGLTWETVFGPAFGLPERGAVGIPSGVRSDPADPSRVWAAIDGELYFSDDGGNAWTVVLAGASVKWIEVAPDSTLYVSGINEVFRSTDGLVFDSIGGPGKPGRLTLDPYCALYLAAHDSTGNPGFGVHRFEDGVWSQIFDDDFAVDVAVDPFDPDRLLVITADPPFRDVSRATGVYLSEDRGASWASVNEGLPILRGDRARFSPHVPGRAVIGTAGRGFFVRSFAACAADTNNDGVVTPADFNAWILAFNSQSPACDQNDDGLCTPADFNAWILNFNAGCP